MIVVAVIAIVVFVLCVAALESAICGCGLELRRIADALGRPATPLPESPLVQESRRVTGNLARIAAALDAIAETKRFDR